MAGLGAIEPVGESGNTDSMTSPTRFLVFAVGTSSALSAIPANCQTDHADPFAKACQARLQKVQEDRRVSAVGIVTKDQKIEIVYSTRDDLVGRTIAVYGSRVVQQQRVVPKALVSLVDRIIVVGGFIDAGAIYSATILSDAKFEQPQ